MFFCQLIYVTTSFQRYINQQIQQCPLPKVSQRSPESLSAASFDTTMRKTCEMKKIAQNAIQRVLEGIYKTVVALRKF